MDGLTLRLRSAPALRVDLRRVRIEAIGPADAARLPVLHGRDVAALGDWFDIAAREDGRWVFEGDLSRFDRLGWQLDGGEVIVDGPVGHYAGGAMRGGTLHVRGGAGDLAACEMSGGALRIDGDVGAFAASTLPGSLDGMRGGRLVVGGNAGERLADRMRRGTVVVTGDAGDFAASRLVAGTVAIGGRLGAHPAYGMRRGTLVRVGPADPLPATFVAAGDTAPVAWQLIARDLAVHGGPFAGLAGRRPARWRGDRSVGGLGEVFVAG